MAIKWEDIIVDGKKRGVRNDFDSVTDLLTCAVDMPGDIPERARSSRSTWGAYDDWAGCSFDHSVKLAKEGWPEGLDYVAKLSDVIYSHVAGKVFVPHIVLGDEGDGFDVATLMEGEPECFLRWKDSEHVVEGLENRGKIVKIVASVDACGGVDKAMMLRRGGSMVALVHALELSGKRCEVIATVGSRGQKGKQLQNAVTLKTADQPLQMDTLAYLLCHASVLRRLFFSVWETCPVAIRQPFYMGDTKYYGYGAPCESDVEGDIKLGQASYYDSCWQSEEAMIDWCLEQLEKQGIEIRTEE